MSFSLLRNLMKCRWDKKSDDCSSTLYNLYTKSSNVYYAIRTFGILGISWLRNFCIYASATLRQRFFEWVEKWKRNMREGRARTEKDDQRGRNSQDKLAIRRKRREEKRILRSDSFYPARAPIFFNIWAIFFSSSPATKSITCDRDPPVLFESRNALFAIVRLPNVNAISCKMLRSTLFVLHISWNCAYVTSGVHRSDQLSGPIASFT